jgi:hypothetical protein
MLLMASRAAVAALAAAFAAFAAALAAYAAAAAAFAAFANTPEGFDFKSVSVPSAIEVNVKSPTTTKAEQATHREYKLLQHITRVEILLNGFWLRTIS